jgi:hypothetical protein
MVGDRYAVTTPKRILDLCTFGLLAVFKRYENQFLSSVKCFLAGVLGQNIGGILQKRCFPLFKHVRRNKKHVRLSYKYKHLLNL